MIQLVKNEFEQHLQTLKSTQNSIEQNIIDGALLILEQIRNNKKILIFGNGGSAADAQHFSAELVNRYTIERIGIPAIALTTDGSIVTSIANDYNYNRVFARQIEALANEGDIVIAISTSGTSKNIIEALEIAKQKKCKSIGLSGNNGGDMKKYCDVNIIIPSDSTARIQEMHIFVIHTICEIIDNNFKG